MLAPWQKIGNRLNPDDFMPGATNNHHRQTPDQHWQVGQAYLQEFRKSGGEVLTDPGF